MESKTTTPATHDSLPVIFQTATIDKAEQSELFSVLQSSFACVTPETTSDSSNFLDESNHPLQGIDIPTLQALTTPDSDYIHLSATISVTLPQELVERIILLLDTKSMLTCRLVNREFNEIILSSTLLQYILACEAAGVIDNPQSPLSYAERLEALKKREDAWRKLKPVFEMTITVNHRAAWNTCRSNEGVYFLDDDNQKDMNCCNLASFPQNSARWMRIPGHGPVLDWSGILVNFGSALYEHDLIVNVISYDIGNQAVMQQHSLDLVLLKFSTGDYHPLARRPQIHVQTLPEVEPWVVSRIVGDNLALVVGSKDGTFSDQLFVFNWKTGCKLLQHEAAEGAYPTVDFISPKLLLLPNLILSHFEIWHLPPSSRLPAQILSLSMPAISPEYTLLDFSCYVAPNPFLHSMSYLPPQPFSSSPENSIIVTALKMSSNPGLHASYWHFIMHRRALIDTIQTWTSPSFLEQQDLPTWLTNEIIVHQIADLEGGLVELCAESRLVPTEQHERSSPQTRDSPTFPTSHISTDPGPSYISSGSSTTCSSTSRCTFPKVPWEKWGPPISRWFEGNGAQHQRLGHCNGQRCMLTEPNPHDSRKLIVNVVDFNPHNCRKDVEKMVQLRCGEGENNDSSGNNEKEKEEEEEFEILDHKGVFSEEVYMGLKYVVYRAPDEYDFDLVLMDEKRLFGLKLSHDGLIESVKVLYIG